MATWHQMRNRAPLYDPKYWVVLIDPPNAPRSRYLSETRDGAETYLENLRNNNPREAEYAVILPPSSP